jgi:hypothetical protein
VRWACHPTKTRQRAGTLESIRAWRELPVSGGVLKVLQLWLPLYVQWGRGRVCAYGTVLYVGLLVIFACCVMVLLTVPAGQKSYFFTG